jgi:hypothetical protein
MKVHPRLFKVQKAGNEIGSAITTIASQHELTVVEVVGVLINHAAQWQKYSLREERHPEDPSKRADEA